MANFPTGYPLKATPVGADIVLIADSANGNDIAQATVLSLTNATGGMQASTYDPANIAQQLVGTTAVQTVTNKTISGSSNTLSNIPLSATTGTLAIANGGTGQTTQSSALTALTGSQTAGWYVRSDGTNSYLNGLGASDLVGAVSIANGGTGQSTRQNALNALTGSSITGAFLEWNGTNAVWSALPNSVIIGQALTGFVSGAGSVSSGDTILTAFEKIDGNTNLKAPIASPTFTGTVTLPAGQIVNGVTLTTGGGTTTFLNANGTYTTPSGSGSGTVTSVTSANSDISVANTTTTPVLTLASGTGTGSIVRGTSPTLTGATLTTSTVNGVTISTTAGTSAFLRGDGTYAPATGGGSGTVTSVTSSNADITITNTTTTPVLTLSSGTGSGLIVRTASPSLSTPTITNTVTIGSSFATTGIISLLNSTNGNNIQIKSGVTSTSYTLTLPTAVASAGQVLTDVAGNGILSWATPSGGFTSRVKAHQGTSGSLLLDTVDYDNLSEWNTGTQTFTASATGYYLITLYYTVSGGSFNYLTITHNATIINKNGTGSFNAQISCVEKLTATDTITFQQSGPSLTASAGAYNTFMTITRIQ